MRTVANVEEITITLNKEDTLNGNWVSFYFISEKLKQEEENKKLPYKYLRNRFYNSITGKKYRTADISGVKYISIKDTMTKKASLCLKFEVKNA